MGLSQWGGQGAMGAWGCETNPIPSGSQTRLHRELIGLLRQHSAFCDQRHLVLWAIKHWQKPGQALHLALDTTMMWNR